MITSIFSIAAMMPVFLIGTLGELLSQKSGVYNLGIEGVMAFGAITAFLSYNFLVPSLWIALFFGLVGGMFMGVLNSFFSIRLKLDQVVVGFGLWFLGVGLAGFIRTTFLSGKDPVPIFPKIVLALDLVFFINIALWVIMWIMFSKTSIGLRIKSVGENPIAADMAGVDVFRVRWLCVIVGCGLIGVAGSYLFMNFVQDFRTMVSGFGWMCFALVMFSRWKVPYTLIGTAIFTGINGIQTRLQVRDIIILPFEFMNVLAYVAVIIGLVIAMATGGKGAMPKSLYIPYERE